jgi:hypothetical protein
MYLNRKRYVRRRTLVATLTKNLDLTKEELQPSSLKFFGASSPELVRFSEDHKKKQEVNFDLLCLWVPGAGLEPAQP